MKAILILGAVLLALGALLRLVRLGALAEYSAAGLRLKLKVGPLRLMLYPRKPKRPRRKAGKSSRREKKREERPQPELGGGPLALVKRFLPLIAEAAGRFRRKLRIDVFQSSRYVGGIIQDGNFLCCRRISDPVCRFLSDTDIKGIFSKVIEVIDAAICLI